MICSVNTPRLSTEPSPSAACVRAWVTITVAMGLPASVLKPMLPEVDNTMSPGPSTPKLRPASVPLVDYRSIRQVAAAAGIARRRRRDVILVRGNRRRRRRR